MYKTYFPTHCFQDDKGIMNTIPIFGSFQYDEIKDTVYRLTQLNPTKWSQRGFEREVGKESSWYFPKRQYITPMTLVQYETAYRICAFVVGCFTYTSLVQ